LFPFAQRLYVGTAMQHIRRLQAAAVAASEIPPALNRAGLCAVNGKRCDVESVAAVIGLDQAMHAADAERQPSG